MVFGRGGNKLRLVIDKIVADGLAKKLRITITKEATDERTRSRGEKTKSQKDACGRECLQSEGPIITAHTINQDEGITIAPHRNAVAKGNVHMDHIKVRVVSPFEGLSSFCFWYSGIRTKRHGEFTAVNPLTITTDIDDVFVIPELSTTHDAMNLLRRPMNLRVGGIICVTWANIRKRCVRMAEKPSDLNPGHSG